MTEQLKKKHKSFLHSPTDGHSSCLHVLAVVNSAAVNIGMHVSFQIIVLSRYMLRSGIAGSYGNSSVLRNHHAILHSRRHNLHSHEQFTVHS